MAELDHLVKLYFRLSFSNKEILSTLANYDTIIISTRTLKRICKRLGLFRRKKSVQFARCRLLAFVQHEMTTRGQMQGYRWLHPNALWHLDSYDKLKPYGIAINGV